MGYMHIFNIIDCAEGVSKDDAEASVYIFYGL